MVSLGKRLRMLREERWLTQDDIGKVIGVTKSNISKYELDIIEPNLETLKALAKFYQVSVDFLVGRPDEIREAPTPYGVKEFVTLPILGVIRAGEPLYAEQNIIGYESAPADLVKGGEYFYLRVTGDSMFNPVAGKYIQEGTLVMVRKQDDVDNGEVAVVLINNEEATVKRVYKNNGQVVLHADNTNYAPLIISKGDLKIIGKVVKATFDVL
ncbi:MAG: helix-turn-helix domain-containing protein [Firmicutes bacterium]|nr:helix-turn-helix domain-containing protein [Bacillota bacterium]